MQRTEPSGRSAAIRKTQFKLHLRQFSSTLLFLSNDAKRIQFETTSPRYYRRCRKDRQNPTGLCRTFREKKCPEAAGTHKDALRGNPQHKKILRFPRVLAHFSFVLCVLDLYLRFRTRLP